MKTSQIKIRQASKTDIPTIKRMQQEWFEEDCVYGFLPANFGQLQHALGLYFLVAENQNHIVGFISGAVHLSNELAIIPNGRTYVEIEDLYVSPQFRQLGIGSQLIEYFLSQAKSQGVTYALLYSATKEIRSVLQFYERHGFQGWYIQMFREL